MIKIIIVEDDPNHSERLEKLLKQIEEPFEISFIARNIKVAFKEIEKHNPDLVFLDIQLENGEIGFDLLEKYETLPFYTIFTTSFANTEYTIRAIRASAKDYLIKPLMINELAQAIEQYKTDKLNEIEQINSLKRNLEKDQIKEIWIPDRNGKIRVDLSTLMYCKSDNSSLDFFIEEKNKSIKKITSTKSIGDWEDILKNSRIIRIHNRNLVNIDFIDRFNPGKAIVILKNGFELSVSESRRHKLNILLHEIIPVRINFN